MEFEPYMPQDMQVAAIDQVKSWVENVFQLNQEEWASILTQIVKSVWRGELIRAEEINKF